MVDDPGDPVVDTLSDPDQQWTRLAQVAAYSPTAVDSSTGALLALRYDEIDRLAHDRRMAGVGLSFFDMMGIEGELRDWYGSLMFTNDGPAHDRLRRLVSRAFTPRSVGPLRDYARTLVDDRLGALARADGGDLVQSLRDVPIRVMCRLLGVPEEDVAVFMDWADALSPVFGLMDEAQIRAARAALDGLLGYVSNLVARRATEPADDLITALLQAEEDGERLQRGEVVTMVASLLVGGHDTTSSQIGCSLLTLLRHPAATEELRAGRATAGDAVSETMRFEPSIGAIPRTAHAPVEVGGRERPAGTLVMLAVGTGNRDPAVWERPDTFVVDRFASPSTPHLLSFGRGAHYCLGANLARMTLEETVRGFTARQVTPLGDPDRVSWRVVLGRSPAELPVQVA